MFSENSCRGTPSTRISSAFSPSWSLSWKDKAWHDVAVRHFPVFVFLIDLQPPMVSSPSSKCPLRESLESSLPCNMKVLPFFTKMRCSQAFLSCLFIRVPFFSFQNPQSSSIQCPSFSSSATVTSYHLFSAELKVKKQWNGPKASIIASNSFLAACQNFGVPLIFLNIENVSWLLKTRTEFPWDSRFPVWKHTSTFFSSFLFQ